jgi:hypothetical protein
MKIQTIRPYDGYFIDEVHVNIKFPFEKLSRYNRDVTKHWFKNFAELHLSRPRTNGAGFNQVHTFGNGITFKKDKHYNYQIRFGGKFFADRLSTKINKDVYNFYTKFIEIHDFIQSYYERYVNKNERFYCTISRLDIAKNFIGANMLNAIPIAHQNKNEIRYYESQTLRKGLPYLYGFSIGKRKANNGIAFRAYDKRFDIPGIEGAINRFGSIYFVRKEWEMKNSALRGFNIRFVEDLVNAVKDKKKLTEIVYRMRKSSDCILTSDKELYRSIHDDLTRSRINHTDNYVLTEHQFNDMLKKDYSIFPKKVDVRKIKRIEWNPLSTIQGLLGKYGRRLEPNEIMGIIAKLVGSIDETIIENKDYQKEIEGLMQYINKDDNIKKKLKEMRVKRDEINEYTHNLIENKNKLIEHKKNASQPGMS